MTDTKGKPALPRTPSGQRPAVVVPRTSEGTPAAPKVASVPSMPAVKAQIKAVEEAPTAPQGAIVPDELIRAIAKLSASEVVSNEVSALVTRISRLEEQVKKLTEREQLASQAKVAAAAATPPPAPVAPVPSPFEATVPASPSVAAMQSAAPSIAPAPWHIPVSTSQAPPAGSVPPPGSGSVPPPARARMSSIPLVEPVELPRDLESALDGSRRKKRIALSVVLVLVVLVGGLVAMMLASQIKA